MKRNERNFTKLSLKPGNFSPVSPKLDPLLDPGSIISILLCYAVQTKRTRRPKLLPIVQGSFSPLCKAAPSYQVLLCKAAHTPSQVSPPAASQLLHHPPSSHHPYSPSAMYTSQLHQSQLLPLLKLHTRPLSSYSTSQPRTFNNIP